MLRLGVGALARGHRYYSVLTKTRGRRRRIHDAKTGRILKWIDADTLDEPHGEFKIVEYVMNFRVTKGKNLIGFEWEVRIRMPVGIDISEAEDIARSTLIDLTNEGMVDTADFNFDKKGIDFIEFSSDGTPLWKVVNRTNPQYKYPKETTWGTSDIDRED